MKKKYLFSYIFLLILLLAGLALIAVWEFPNRNLTIKFYTDKGIIESTFSSLEISEGNCKQIKLYVENEPLNEVNLTKARVYGNLKSMFSCELDANTLWHAIYLENSPGAEWKDGIIHITGGDEILLCMNDSFTEILQEESASFLQERFVIASYYFCFIAILFLVVFAVKERQTDTNFGNHGFVFEVKKFISDIKKYRQYIDYSARADLKAEVANSYLNRLWWLLEPFFNMIVYVVVFGNIMGNSVENYATFVFSALLMWSFFNKAIIYSVKLVRNNKDIISKVYIPKFVILLSNMVLNIYKLLFSMIVLVVMMIVFRVSIGINLLWVIPTYVIIILLAFGFGMIFLHFGVYVDDLSYAVGILLNMLMFLSGIFYDTMTTLPRPLNVIMMTFNPIALVVDSMRNALLYNSLTNLPMLGVWFILSLITCYIGVHIVYKNENSYVKIV